MTESRADLLDFLLKGLYKSPNAYFDARAIFKQLKNLDDNALTESIVNEILERGWVKHGNTKYYITITFEGRQVIDKYGSYSSWLRRNRWRKRFTSWSTRLTTLSNVAAIISTAFAVIFGILSYRLDASSNKLEKENQQLHKIIDSLKTKKPSLQVFKKDK